MLRFPQQFSAQVDFYLRQVAVGDGAFYAGRRCLFGQPRLFLFEPLAAPQDALRQLEQAISALPR
jgi:hypothetical protein